MGKPNQLEIAVKETGLAKTDANKLKDAFMPFFNQAEEWQIKANKINVTSVEQVGDMKDAKTARLALKSIRVDCDHTRKSMKEDALRTGKAIDGMFNIIKFLIEPIEKHLYNQENFVFFEEQRIKKELEETRLAKLEPFDIDTEHYRLGEMSEEAFNQVFEGAKAADEANMLKAKEEEKARVKAERAKQAEEIRIRKENTRLAELNNAGITLNVGEARKTILCLPEKEWLVELKRLKKEKLDVINEKSRLRDRQQRILDIGLVWNGRIYEYGNSQLNSISENPELLPEYSDTKFKARLNELAKEVKAEQKRETEAEQKRVRDFEAQQLATKRAEKEIQDKKDAEKKRLADEKKAEEKATKAPDKQKLTGIIIRLQAFHLPEMKSKEGKDAMAMLADNLNKAISQLKTDVRNL